MNHKIIYYILFGIILYLYYEKIKSKNIIEKFSTGDIDMAAIKSLGDLASKIYSNGKLILPSDVEIQGNLDVKGTNGINVGKWKIRDNKIGIPGLGDLNWNDDGWLRTLKYNSDGLGDYITSGIGTNNIYATGTGDFVGKLSGHAGGKMGQWEIRNRRIGIPGGADLNMHTDYPWVKLVDYDHNGGDSHNLKKGCGFDSDWLSTNRFHDYEWLNSSVFKISNENNTGYLGLTPGKGAFTPTDVNAVGTNIKLININNP